MSKRLFDVVICGLNDSTTSCIDTLTKAGLRATVVAPETIKNYMAAAYILSSHITVVDNDAHIVVVDRDTAEDGKAAAYEILAELFDDSEPADEI